MYVCEKKFAKAYENIKQLRKMMLNFNRNSKEFKVFHEFLRDS